MTEKCPGSSVVVSNRLTGPGHYECLDCKQFVPMRDGRLKVHDRDADEFGNTEREIRMVAVAAHARGDYEAERIALDRLALMERRPMQSAGEQHEPR